MVLHFRCAYFRANFFTELTLHLIDLLLDDNRTNLIFGAPLSRHFPLRNQFFHPIKTAQLLSFFAFHIGVFPRKTGQQSKQMFSVGRLSFSFSVLVVVDGHGFVIGVGLGSHGR